MFAEEGEGVECGHGSSRASGEKMGVILTLVSQRWVGKYGVCFLFIGSGLG